MPASSKDGSEGLAESQAPINLARNDELHVASAKKAGSHGDHWASNQLSFCLLPTMILCTRLTPRRTSLRLFNHGPPWVADLMNDDLMGLPKSDWPPPRPGWLGGPIA